MSEVFDHYALYYDLLYRDKDYAAEAAYVASHIREFNPSAKTILELGCGTGGHAEFFARMGFTVVGIDMSVTMLNQAEMRKAKLPTEIAERLTFIQGDVRSIRTGEQYDAVISLFHVMSYQTSNADLENSFATAAVHLKPSGVFLFDFWYGPAVLIQKPEVRVKRLEDNTIKVTRIAEPVLHANANVADVNYTIFIEDNLTGKAKQIRETHKMRYLFLPELNWMLPSSNLEIKIHYAWLECIPLSFDSWSGVILAIPHKI
ncbi:class I SAM-dependent methyltransferase [Methylomonas sp. LL1]|uniref:class I SAM-dependent DNA methyltransferase n=1 Tax=Methylomonas sp. LL1 TaxID=2785785 RepID=UPI0018C39AE9|nr:class I SAM-dependent methyltransferase [Methylomonas sp. LL1]QPK63425.1 class I SAM-dependent methyltransferase [Methylomonas sp. LL1]